jgi:hypothetical protein
MSSLARDISALLRAGFLIAGLTGCGPGVDPVTKADIARRVALLGQSPLQVAAPAVSQPRPFVVGQWTQHKVVGVIGPAFLTTKIVGMESDAFWFETVVESEVGKVITKLLVFVGDRGDPNTIKVLAGRIRSRSDNIVHIAPSELARYRKLFDVVASWEGQPQEDAVAPAGTFRSCFKGKNVWERWLVGPSSLAWSHPAVPISGLVRAAGIKDQQPWFRRQSGQADTSTELVGFGDSGATSELP